MHIKKFLAIDNNLATSGQPGPEQFRDIADLGFETLVNLALPTSDNALANEGAIVTGLGMNYIHIPVVWEDPRAEQFGLFAAVMNSHKSGKIWVHCALNMRVSVFVYLYRRLHLDVPEPVAEQTLHEIWQPNSVWNDFIERIKSGA